jgi:hypothetical protein
MTPAQCRAARGLLGWDPPRLAAAAGIDIGIVTEFEGESPVNKTAIRQMQRALEQAGVEFTNDGAPGVRRRPAPRVLGIDELNASNDE